MQYSIHRCLIELNLLESKIDKATNKKFIGYMKNSANGEYNTHMIEEDFTKEVLANLNKVQDLIKRRTKIKQAVTNSNAVTIREISGKKYTVAAAIERKKSISYEKDLLAQLKYQYNSTLRIVTENNDRMENNLDKQISQMVGSDNSKTGETAVFAEFYRKQNGYKELDPLNLKNVIQELEKEIEEFESEVDCILSESNATTMVEIED